MKNATSSEPVSGESKHFHGNQNTLNIWLTNDQICGSSLSLRSGTSKHIKMITVLTYLTCSRKRIHFLNTSGFHLI